MSVLILKNLGWLSYSGPHHLVFQLWQSTKLNRPTKVRIIVTTEEYKARPPLLFFERPHFLSSPTGASQPCRGLEWQMAPPVKGWQVSKNRRRSSLFWSGLETHRREQRAGASATKEEAQVQPQWLRINHGTIYFHFPMWISQKKLSLILDLRRRISIYMLWLFVLSSDPHHHIMMSILLVVHDDLFLQTLDLCRRILISVFSLFILWFISP